MGFFINLLIIIGCALAGALAGFFVPFILAQWNKNTALSMVTMITVPIGIFLGLISGIIYVIM